MQLSKKIEDNRLTVLIEGRIDTTTAPQLEGELRQIVTDEVIDLIFDFSKVEYMSSAGIRVIMSAEKIMRRQGAMTLIHVNEDIMEILEMTGLIDILTVQ
ncbi:STAS domain-containing protein [Aminipila butyrica]|uniref:Anti-sigma factor antagonist n=1 Tax=Aminipila butyrica TaxID=433296 RepID=A0A858BX78_9FIRM|nr:STAS domain-containing protein [Aminipila butyrica]QIB69324.1 STAS domain-containing protein [Aminipila butyrica]